MMQDRENRFPPAMQDVGTPEEMSPTEGITESYNETPPIVEVNRPLSAGEPTEIREALALGDIREERLDK
ncbi:hypothetical protein LOK74_13470 [Brevibacillus humidisoli]|uniref:hypothetical protein n=1 Tax=Brevibacillus humidisoli TaxID=2895522 RepID=UPI001E60F25A|nr:hypothetical protein [Brevibacillus humidisoli]UFJ39084.1 hypothetical protein LOK74_13470 [Brevibacillus humidisoli]